MNERHGLIKHPIYTSWRAMLQRCLNKKSTNWTDYGGRGISVCPQWREFTVFYAWAVQSGWAEGLTIDRIDVNGNYEPGNCRWATKLEQALNQRPKSLMLPVTINGVTLNVRGWSLKTGIPPATLYKRYKQGIRGAEFIAKPKNPATPKPIEAPPLKRAYR